MFMRAAAMIFGLLALVLPMSSSAQQARGNVFEVEAKIYSEGRLIGNPIVRAMAGSEVVVAHHDVNGYGIRFTIDDDHINPSSERVNINSRLYMPQNGNWALVAAPEVQAKVGATSRVQSGPQYTVEFTTKRLDMRVSANDLRSLEDCPTLKAFGDSTALKGVTVVGTGVFKASLQENPEEPGSGDPTSGNCCRSGTMTCCGTPGAGVCCKDGMNGNSCCAPN